MSGTDVKDAGPSGADGADGIALELFKHRFAAVAEEMGEVLTRAAFSPNIKERRDHSCAVFDAAGDMVAQAAHIPVHLGAAPLCVKAVIGAMTLADGETAVVNDPFAGGTHLPDVTLVTAVDIVTGSGAVSGAAPDGPGAVVGRMYVATRAHHADVGGISPGSLPLSQHIDDEGWRCPPSRATEAVLDGLIAASRTPEERRGDLAAQRAANAVGVRRLRELAAQHGAARLLSLAAALQGYAGRLSAAFVAELPSGEWQAEDALDDAFGDGVAVPIRLLLTVADGRMTFDFRASADQVAGPMNAVRAIVESAVFYAMRCVVPGAPGNSGLLAPVDVLTRPGSVVDALPPAAVAAGNVETSQRLVDVVFQALGAVLPDRMPASSYGSMNNVLLGTEAGAERPFVYYETIGGGHGGGPAGPGASGMQAHMTNTLNTPVEALEHAFPLRIVRYHLREQSGGAGHHAGGDGIVREYEALTEMTLTVIGERRLRGARGAQGGADGAPGTQRLERADGGAEVLPGKATRTLAAGDRLVVETPGGGGWGAA